jgi:8-oxo-dGTP diphosphatase
MFAENLTVLTKCPRRREQFFSWQLGDAIVNDKAESGVAALSIHVVAGVINGCDGRVLVTQRPPGKSMAGAWEFPGGKLAPGESAFDGLVREFDEELGLAIEAARPLIRYRYCHPAFEVQLDAWCVERWSGEPKSREGQAFAWRVPEDLLGIGLLPADAAIVRAIQLPSVCCVTPPDAALGEAAFFDTLTRSANHGLVCLRRPDLEPAAFLELAARTTRRLAGSGKKLLLHGDPTVLAPALLDAASPLLSQATDVIAGLHIPARFLVSLNERPVSPSLWFGASCHDARELEAALVLGADYAFLGPVHTTTSHPGAPGMGWEAFSALVADVPLPTYAIGGLGPDDLKAAWHAGAQGVAAIRSLWTD